MGRNTPTRIAAWTFALLALLALGAAPLAAQRVAPQISTAPHHPGFRDAGAGTATLSYATPAYVSRDQPRSAALFYTSGQAAPLGFVQVDATDASGDAPQRMTITVVNPWGYAVTPELSYAAGSGANRLAAVWDASGYGSGALVHTVVVRSYWADGTVLESSASVRVPILNEAGSRFGAGWGMAGLQRLVFQADGLFVVNGDGSGTFFTTCPGCGYTAPEGDFSTLAAIPGGGYTRTWPDGTRVVFRADGLMSYRENRLGERDTYAWGATSDGVAVPVSVTDPVARQITFGYTPTGYLSTITDPGGRVSQVQYSGVDVYRIIGPDGRAAFTATYGTHQLSGWTDPAGGQWNVAYDRGRGLATLTAPQVATTDAGVTRPVTTLHSLMDAVLVQPGYGFSGQPASPRVIPANVRVSASDPRGNTTQVTVDRFGAATRIEEPLGRVTVYLRDAHSRVTRSVTPSGDSADYTYTGPNLTRTVNHGSGKTVDLTYTTDNQLRTSYDGDELLEHTYETVNGRSRLLTTVVGSEAHAYEYVDDGRLSREIGPGSTVIHRYEPSGAQNRNEEYGPGGIVRYTSHDALGRASIARVALYPYYARGDSVRFDYDVLNRIRHSYDPAGNTTTFDYDSVTTRVTDAKGQVYTTTANALGWVVSRSDPGSRVESFGYDRAGNLTSHTNRRGQTVTYGYDALNRLRWRDADGQRTTYDPDVPGTLTATANAESVDSVRVTPYDVAGQTASMTQVTRRGGARYQLVSSSVMNGTFTSLELNTPGAGYTATYAMSAVGTGSTSVFRGVCAFSSSASCTAPFAPPALWSHVRYPEETSLVGVQLIDVGQDTVVAGGDSITYRRASLAQALSVRYTRDGINRVARRTNLAGDSVRSFRYDNLGRLAAWGDTVASTYQDCYYDQSLLQEFCRDLPYAEGVRGGSFTYDVASNRTDGGAVLDPGNRLRAYVGFGLDYDADGNLTHKYKAGYDQQLTWNSLGQLVQVVTNGQTVTYGYDGEGRRVRRTVNGVATRFLYNGMHRVADLDASGNVLAEYTYYPGTDRPHAVRVNGSVYYYLADGPGNVVGLVDTYGNLVNEYRYGPFGESEMVREAVPQPFRFTGRELDAETGLYYFRARYYDAIAGRFISEDPLGLRAGLNAYVYLGNDPVNGRDPSGLQQDCRFVVTRVVGNFDVGFGSNPWLNVFYHWDCAPMVQTTGAGNFGGAHDCVVTSSCMNQAEELNRISQIQTDQEYAADEPARQRASTAVQSSPYYSPGLADVVMGDLASWSKSAYPALTTYATVGLAAPLGVIGLDAIAAGGGATWLQIQSPSIVPIGNVLPYTQVPQGFLMQAGGQWYNVIPSGAKHFAEFAKDVSSLSPEMRMFAMDVRLRAFQASVAKIAADGYQYGSMYRVGGWEIGFSAARNGWMDVIFHGVWSGKF
jgi:RHS repeat-associated protein